jgi:hypothetical protein
MLVLGEHKLQVNNLVIYWVYLRLMSNRGGTVDVHDMRVGVGEQQR